MRPFPRMAAAAGAMLLLGSCIPRPQPLRAKTPLVVGVALVEERDGGEVAPLPERAAAAVTRAVTERNLRPKAAGRETVEVAFRTRRTSAHRLSAIAEAAPDAELLLLVETRTRFYSQLNGRYRWTVDGRVSLAKQGAREDLATAALDVPVFLDFDHQREADALAGAAPRIAALVGRLLDDYLAGLGAATGARPEDPGVRVAGPAVGPAGAGRAARTVTPADESIYFVLVDRFANGDPGNDGDADASDPQGFHGGDLRGVLDRLDHIQSLGVSTVWLSPVFAMRTGKFHGHGAYHGYWTTDFARVEPRFGDEAILERLSRELHRRGMKLVLDVVLNHVAPDAPLTKEHPEWFHGKGAITDWNDPEQLWTRDVFGLPDLAQEREDVYRYLLASTLRWVDAVEPDGFRLDAARHVPTSFWARYTRDVRAHRPGFRLLGEMYDGDAEGLSRTLESAGFDAVFDFPLYFAMDDVFCKDRPPARLASTLSLDRLYPDPSRLVTFLDNHDLPRVLSACGGDVERVAQALAFQLTARGVPSFTYGIEAGLTGAGEPENRGDMRFGANHPLEDRLRALLALRREHPVLATGAARPVSLTGDTFAYARIDPREAALIAVNRGASEVAVRLPEDLAGPATDALTGERLGSDAVRVPPGSLRIALLSPKRGAAAAAASAKRPRVLSTRFRATGVPAGEKDVVLVVGSAPELGSWSPGKGKVLRAVGKKGTFTGDLPLATGAYEWKLVVRTRSGEVRWEAGDNRFALIETSGELAAAWRGEPSLGASD